MGAERILAAALVAASTACAAADLRTLFHTVEERERLEKLRRGEPLEVPVAEPKAAPRPSSVTGFVQRSDGKGTIWIDGKPFALGERTPPRVVVPPRDSRQSPGASAPIEIKPSR